MDNKKKNVDQEKVKRFNQKLKDGWGWRKASLTKWVMKNLKLGLQLLTKLLPKVELLR